MSFQEFTVNGFTEEAEKKILQQIERGDIVETLESDDEISAFVDALM